MSSAPASTALLALLTLAAPAAAAPVERPIAVVTVPRPAVTFPRLRALADLVKTPVGVDRDVASLGFDPFDPAALERGGIDTRAPAYVFLPSVRAPLVVELAVAKPALVDELLAIAATRKRGAHALEGAAAKSGPGIYIGPADAPLFVVVRRGAKLFLQLSHERAEPSTAANGLPAIASAERGSHPKNAPELAKAAKEPADLWLTADGTDGVDRVDGVAWLSKGKVEASGRAWLDMTAGLLLGDLASKAGAARRLLARPKDDVLAAELAIRVGRAGIADLLDMEKLSPSLARVVTGELHAVLTRGGSVTLALALDPAATEAQLAELSKALEGTGPGTKPKVLERGGERLLAVVLAGRDGAEAERLLGAKVEKDASPPTSPIDLTVVPTNLLEALEERARAKNGPQLSRSRVAGARVMLDDQASAVKRLHLELGLPPGFVEAKLSAEYEPRVRKR